MPWVGWAEGHGDIESRGTIFIPFLNTSIVLQWKATMDLEVDVGRFFLFLLFLQEYQWDLLYPFKSKDNGQKIYCIWPTDGFIVGHRIFGCAQYKGKQIFFDGLHGYENTLNLYADFLQKWF
jgi:hypothetical protein